MEAARDAKRKLLKLAAILLDEDADNLAVRDERIFVKGRPDTGVAIADVASHADSPLVVVTDDGPRPTKLSERGTIIGVSSMRPPASPSPAAAEFVEVEVDTETGKIDVLSVVYAHDIGRIINPAGAEGQVEGGFQQGMGYALMEHLQFDPDTGACVSGDFLDYKMPTAVEMPPRIESIFIESNEPTGPFGAKSLSEPAIIVPAAAIANAVYNAVGVRFRELPITPEKVLAGLGGL
jgi:xanthine dehydrogenase molybdenum-binding subunit